MTDTLTLCGGDHPVATLSPDAVLVVDASTCIVLVTPERRITVGNVANWREQLLTAQSYARIYQDDAEARFRAQFGISRGEPR